MSPPGSKGQATRESIRRTAAIVFRARGYGAATLEDVASVLGITRQAILYHFPTKEDLLDGVVSPYLEMLKAILDRFESTGHDTPASRRRLITGFVDATIEESLAAGILFRDVTSWDHANIAARVGDRNSRFRRILTGPAASVEAETLATCLLGALVRPVVDPNLDPSTPSVRAAILHATFAIAARIDRDRSATKSAPGPAPAEH